MVVLFCPSLRSPPDESSDGRGAFLQGMAIDFSGTLAAWSGLTRSVVREEVACNACFGGEPFGRARPPPSSAARILASRISGSVSRPFEIRAPSFDLFSASAEPVRFPASVGRFERRTPPVLRMPSHTRDMDVAPARRARPIRPLQAGAPHSWLPAGGLLAERIGARGFQLRKINLPSANTHHLARAAPKACPIEAMRSDRAHPADQTSDRPSANRGSR